uniref:Uncharacterized protein n=1 Tax=Anopheles quadriannulatus TaxID=34691 RepID=A0A182XT70_ANOQN
MCAEYTERQRVQHAPPLSFHPSSRVACEALSVRPRKLDPLITAYQWPPVLVRCAVPSV